MSSFQSLYLPGSVSDLWPRAAKGPAANRRAERARKRGVVWRGIVRGSMRKKEGAKTTASSDLRLAFEVESARAFELDAVAGQPAEDLSAAPRGLEGAQRGFAQPPSPVGRQHAVRGAGHGILRNAPGRSEVAADEVV